MTKIRAEHPVVTVVTPVYNEEDNLENYAAEVREVLLDREDAEFRVFFVDDGSTDESWHHIERICAGDDRFRAVRLSRNFGSHTALTSGFLESGEDADAVATLACDLQDPPETVARFLEQWRAGADIVWGARRTRGDSFWRIRASRFFHRLLRRYAMPQGSKFETGSFLLADQRVVECFKEFREHNRITFALVAWTGFDQERVEYDRRPRTAGSSGWNFSRMIQSMYDAFVGFSTLPIRLITLASAAAFLIASGLVLYLAVVALAGEPAPGWTSQMLLLAGFFAVQFSLMAILGEYLYRIYTESVRRPLFFVSERSGVPLSGDRRAEHHHPVGAERGMIKASDRRVPSGADPDEGVETRSRGEA